MSFSSSNTSPSNLFMYNSNAEKTLLHLSYIRTAKQQCGITLIRFAFVRFILFRTFSVIFILDVRHGGTSETMNSLFISWKSHPSEVLSEPPPLLESVAGRKYHYPPAFHRRSGKLFRILKLHICRSLFQGLGVWLLWLPRFYTGHRIDVFPMLLFNFQDA